MRHTAAGTSHGATVRMACPFTIMGMHARTPASAEIILRLVIATSLRTRDVYTTKTLKDIVEPLRVYTASTDRTHNTRIITNEIYELSHAEPIRAIMGKSGVNTDKLEPVKQKLGDIFQNIEVTKCILTLNIGLYSTSIVNRWISSSSTDGTPGYTSTMVDAVQKMTTHVHEANIRVADVFCAPGTSITVYDVLVYIKAMVEAQRAAQHAMKDFYV